MSSGSGEFGTAEGLWLEELRGGDPKTVPITLRLLLAQMTTTSKRVFGTMVLDVLGGNEGATAFEAVGRSGLGRHHRTGPTP